MSLLGKVFAKLGVDPAIRNVLIARIWSTLAGPVSILFVAHYLSPVEQGYYYTFSSIQGMQVFFELGLSFVIMQFASHEKAGLEWTDRQTLEGNSQNKQRLGSLLHFTVRWYGVIAAVAFAVLVFAGILFFSTTNPDFQKGIQWREPWIIVVLTTSISLFFAPIYGIVEGCGRIAEIKKILAWQAMATSLVLWIGLWFGAKLYALALAGVAPLVITLPWFLSRNFPMLKDIWESAVGTSEKISWRKEIWPMQWKISLSALSGYIIFQLANPILFRTQGPVVAGKYGMTMRIVESIQWLAYSWTSTKAATFGSLIASGELVALKSLFRKATVGALAAFTIFATAMLLCVEALRLFQFSFAERFLGLDVMAVICLNAGLNCFIFSVAALLRAEKKEPFLWLSLGAALGNAVFIVLLVPRFGPWGIVLPFFLVNLLIALPVTCTLYRRFWRQHQESEATLLPKRTNARSFRD